MLRALFFAVGAFIALTGGGLFVVDKVVLNESARRSMAEQTTLIGGSGEIDPPAWLPYTCSSCGVLTMLYAMALPRKR